MSRPTPPVPQGTKPRRRRSMANLAVVLVALLVSLGGAEILLRAYPSLIDINLLTRFHQDLRLPIATRLGFVTSNDMRLFPTAERTDGGRPFFINLPGRLYVNMVDEVDIEAGAVVEQQMDATGFCNPPEKADRATADIIMIGDSFSNCITVEVTDAIMARVEESTGLNTYDLGVNSMGPFENLELLIRFGLKLSPKVVVLSIYEGNDLRDTIRHLDFVAQGSSKKNRKRTGGLFAVSYALAYLKAGIELTRKRLKKRNGINFRYSVDVQGTRTPMNVANLDTDEIEHARWIESGEISLDVFAAPLEAFVALSVKHGFIPVVTRLPSPHSAYRESARFEDEAVGREAVMYSQSQGDWLAGNADRIGYRFIDTLPAFREQVRSRPLAYFPANVHLTRTGHAIAAEVLGPELQRMVGTR